MSDREAREKKVVEAVRELLPEIGPLGQIVIRELDPPGPNGELFVVEKQRAYVCTRGGEVR